jgi:ligand-binding sensor domain-containing protein
MSLMAQEPKFRHFDVSEGLPSSTVYQAFQDSKGYVWFCTEAGITRFDGTYIENFTMDDGLADNEIFGLFEDSKGRIWTRSYNGKYAYFQNGYIYNEYDFPFFEEMELGAWVTEIFEDSDGNVYFAASNRGFVVLTADNQVIKKYGTGLQKQVDDFFKKEKNDTPFDGNIKVIGFREVAKNNISIITSHAEYSFNPETRKITLQKFYSNQVSQIHYFNKDQILATHSKHSSEIFLYKNNDFEPYYDGSELSHGNLLPLDVNEKGQLLLGTLGNGLYEIDDFFENPKVGTQYLANKAVSYFLEDTEGNFWFSTLGDGVFMLPKNSVLTYTTNENLASNDLYSVTGDDNGRIYVGNNNGQINVLETDGSISLLEFGKKNARGYNRITSILVDEEKSVWASSDMGLKVWGKNITTNIKNLKALKKDQQCNVFISTSNGVYKIAKTGGTSEIWDKRATAVYPNKDSTAWIGSNQGLYFYDGKEVIAQKSKSKLFESRVSDLEKTSNGILCICSGNGLILKKGDTIKHLTARNGLVGNLCRDLFIEKEDNTIWMAANTGISHFKINPEDLSLDFIVNYSESDNLASNDIRAIYADNDRVWMATSDGLSYFDEKPKKMTSVPPPIYITNIKIWERDTSIHPVYNLPYNEDNIRIGYTGISFRSGNRISYEYRMEGIDKDWVTSYVPEAQYPDLRPGVYTFKVRAVNIDGMSSETPATVKFIIRSPWWATWWFRLISVLVIGGIVYFVFNYASENKKQKEQLRRQIVESEQMALRAQMNPHFVFNALNSIQHFITMEDEMSANYYLSRFSKLIRRVLENSKHSYININEEIETLKLYLELEMLRFENKFEYEIKMDTDINDYDTEIPSMIIQPFLENAIWHGLMPKEGESKLTLHFEQSEEFVICTVRDNGVGRKAASKANENRSEDHKSTGIANTVKRLGLFSNGADESTLMQITDLEEDGKALGTLVTLKIPFK